MTTEQETAAGAAAVPTAAQQVQITPERNAAANKIASVFNSLDMFLHTLAHEAPDSNGNVQKVYSKYLENSIMRLSESANHAIKHVLMFGEPVRQAEQKQPPAAPPAPIENNDSLPTATPYDEGKRDEIARDAAATPAPIGVVDPPQVVEPVAPAPAVADAAAEALAQ